MQKFLIVTGFLLIIIGIGWPLVKKFGLGHLPGDFLIKRENFIFYFPLTTSILISLVIAIIFWLLRR